MHTYMYEQVNIVLTSVKARNSGVLQNKVAEIDTAEHVSPFFKPEICRQIQKNSGLRNQHYYRGRRRRRSSLHVELVDNCAVLEDLKLELVARGSAPGRDRIRDRKAAALGLVLLRGGLLGIVLSCFF